MQLQGDERNWQPEKKIKIGFTLDLQDSRAVRGPALDAANDPVEAGPRLNLGPMVGLGQGMEADAGQGRWAEWGLGVGKGLGLGIEAGLGLSLGLERD